MGQISTPLAQSLQHPGDKENICSITIPIVRKPDNLGFVGVAEIGVEDGVVFLINGALGWGLHLLGLLPVVDEKGYIAALEDGAVLGEAAGCPDLIFQGFDHGETLVIWDIGDSGLVAEDHRDDGVGLIGVMDCCGCQ